MDHVAILSKKFNFLNKILTGEKSIESRWYVNKITPWNSIKKDDIVYFKNSSEQIKIKAVVKKVLQFDNLNDEKIRNILLKYGERIGFDLNRIEEYIKFYERKNYCVLMFLENPKRVEPFSIDKKGFGNACAWLSVNNINRIKTN